MKLFIHFPSLKTVNFISNSTPQIDLNTFSVQNKAVGRQLRYQIIQKGSTPETFSYILFQQLRTRYIHQLTTQPYPYYDKPFRGNLVLAWVGKCLAQWLKAWVILK